MCEVRKVLGIGLVCLGISCVAEAGKLKIAYADFPPFGYRNEKSQEFIGVDADLVREIFTELKYDFSIDYVPWNRAKKEMADAKKGENRVCCSFTVSFDEENKKQYYYSKEISTSVAGLYKKKSLKLEPVGAIKPEDLRGLKIGTIDGYVYSSFLTDAIAKKYSTEDKIGANEFPELNLFRMLKLGRVDVIEMDLPIAQWMINKYKPEFDSLEMVKQDEKILLENAWTQYFVIGKSYPNAKKIIEDFNKALDKMVANGRRKQIAEKYGVTFVKANSVVIEQ